MKFWKEIVVHTSSLADWWLKRRLREAGFPDIPVTKICGNMSSSGKEDVMTAFRRWSQFYHVPRNGFRTTNYFRVGGVLVCTDVASMGLNTPGLVLGVSLGMLIQYSFTHSLPPKYLHFVTLCRVHVL